MTTPDTPRPHGQQADAGPSDNSRPPVAQSEITQSEITHPAVAHPHIAQTPADMPDRATILSMSGLQFMQGVRDGTLPGPPIAGIMGFAVVSVRQGECVFTGTPDFAHLNPVGGVHGGWYGTLLDSCMGCAVMTAVPQGSVYTTLEYKVNITRAIPPGTTVTATGTLDHAGRSTGVATGRITGPDGTLYATGSTTCLIMKVG